MKVSTPKLAYVCSGLHAAKKFNINTIDWNYPMEIVTFNHEPNGPSSLKMLLLSICTATLKDLHHRKKNRASG